LLYSIVEGAGAQDACILVRVFLPWWITEGQKEATKKAVQTIKEQDRLLGK
jgi:hypothetical protein